MVKSKELKLMRKRLEKADRVEDPLQLIGEANSRLAGDVDDSHALLALQYKSSVDLSTATLQQCFDLFETNMGDLYRNSTWGLDMKEKRDEFQHKKARFLLVTTTTTTAEPNEQVLCAFVHFRFCYDDDEHPEFTVLYVYEIQVNEQYRRQGLGRQLMATVEAIAKAVNLPKVMLTVFQKNTAALQFYQSKLGYCIDASSPSQSGDAEEYEILSKVL